MKSILFIVLLIFSLHAEDLVEYDYELDLYYSNVSAFIDLDRDANITDGSHKSEYELYSTLLKKTFEPNIFLLEASIHPMSIAGLYFRHNHEDLYEKATIQDFNIVKALTAGYEEPYSFSFFLGRMLVFKKKDGSHIGKNRAYIGYLVTIGDLSIKENLKHKDKWVNMEFKLKGTKDQEDRYLDWSFRVGAKIHDNKDFANTLYFGARRSSIDYKKPIASFRYNSAFSTMIGFTTDTLELTQFELLLEKKFPTGYGKLTFGLGLGYLYYSGAKYRGALKEEGIDNHQILLRPNLKW